MINGLIHQEIMTIINMYVSSFGASRHIKNILTHVKGKMCGNKIMVRNVDTQLSTLYRSSGHNINQETLNLNTHLISNEPNIHLQYIPLNSSKLSIVLKYT